MRISASTKPTAQKAFHDIVAIKAEIDSLFKYKTNTASSSNASTPSSNNAQETEKILYGMAVKMKNKYDKYFGKLEDCNQLLFVALVLNPRHKLRSEDLEVPFTELPRVYLTEQTVPPEIQATVGQVHVFELKGNINGDS